MASFKAPSLLPSRKKTPESKSAINQLEVEERKALEVWLIMIHGTFLSCALCQKCVYCLLKTECSYFR